MGRSILTKGSKLNIIKSPGGDMGWGADFYRDEEIDKRLYKKIIFALFKKIKEKILEGADVRLPRLGFIRVEQKRKPQNGRSIGNIHWPNTKKLWKKQPELEGKEFVRIFNDHSDGFMYKVKWLKGKILNRPKFISCYTFIPCYGFRVTLSKLIKEGKEYAIHLGL